MLFVVRTLIVMLALSVAAVMWIVGGLSAAGYSLLFLLATLPGLPLGFAFFGRRHAAGWLSGFLLGYALTAFTCWAVVYLHVSSRFGFVAAWAGASSVTWAAWLSWRGHARAPVVAPPAWTTRDTAALLLVLLLVPALVGPPFAKLGARDLAGDRQYRAYFTADFVWHTALVAELTKHEQPPRNPYLAREPIHYYWTYFLVPATIVSLTGIDVQEALEINALGAALLLVAAVYLAAWAAFPTWPFTIAVAVALTIVAPSAEGLAAIVDLLRRGRPLAELRDLNIDAIASWAFKGLRIDNLPRTMWYTPQHALACAFGLLAIPAAVAAGVRAHLAAIVLVGMALAAAVVFNPLVGAIFSAIYGVTILIDGARQRVGVAGVLKHTVATAFVAAAVGWCLLNHMTEGAGAALQIGFVPPARNAPLLTFLLSFGPLLLPLTIGLWSRSREAPLPSAVPALAGIALSIFLMFFVTLSVDLFWVGFRAGNIFFVLAPALVARGFIVLWSSKREALGVAMAVAVVLLGVPTTLIDAYNTQDVTNTGISPGGFRWTVKLTADQQEGLAWIRTHTPQVAIVQAEPIVRGRETWSLIPTFAERRMAAGLPISLMSVPDYLIKSGDVRRIYATSDPKLAWQLATALGIDYLYVDNTERARYAGVAKFDASPDYFAPVFRNREVGVYAVRP